MAANGRSHHAFSRQLFSGCLRLAIVRGLLRAVTAAAYLLLEVRWRRVSPEQRRGSLATCLRWALLLVFCGTVGSGFFVLQRIAIDHLVNVSGFGLLMLIVGNSVLFGYSGELAGFERRGWFPRFLIFLGILAAVTLMSPAYLPHLTILHHQYAAWTWLLLTLLWLVWHGRRWLKTQAILA